MSEGTDGSAEVRYEVPREVLTAALGYLLGVVESNGYEHWVPDWIRALYEAPVIRVAGPEAKADDWS